MILTVTLNASIDRRYVVDDFADGEVNRVRETYSYPGGKGLNVSKPAVIAGAEVVATGFLGGHAGKWIEENLEPFGITSGFYHVKGESRTCINIWNEAKEEQTEFLEPGPEITEADFDAFMEKFTELLPGASVVSISGSVPKGLDYRAYQKIVETVKEAGKPVVLDTSGKLLEEGVKSLPTLIKPNADEIRALTGLDASDIPGIVEAAAKLHESGIRYVAVSLGGDGSLLVTDEGVFRAKVPKIDAVNTVGCGDTMIAGFDVSIERGSSPEEMLRLASAMSAAAAMREETGYFLPEDERDLYGKIEIEKIG